MKKSLAIILMLAMLLSLCLMGCGGEKSETPGENTENTGAYREITIGYFGTAWAGSLDGSALETQTNSYGTYNLVYDCMFTYDENGEIYSQIFDSWEWSEDYLTLTCRLKDNILFANGDKMTGEDVVYSIRRKVESPTGQWYANMNPDKCTVSDDGMTVNIVYDNTFGPGLNKLNIYILDKSFVEGLGDSPDWYDPASVNGSGPYKVVEYAKDASVSMEKRDDYWGEDSFQADRINAVGYTDQTTMMIDLESGAIDIALNTSEIDTAAALNGDIKNVSGDVAWANSVAMIIFSPKCEALKDKAVREAICYAVDTELMTDAAFGVLGKTAKSPYAEGLLGFEAGHTYEYNPEKARQILEDAGYKDGDITLKYLCYNLSEIYSQAEILQQYLSKVGINLEIEGASMATAIGTYIEDPYSTDIIMMRQLDGIPDGEPWFSMYVYEGTYYFGETAMPDEAELQEYIHTLKTSLVESERVAASKGIQNYLIDNFLMLPTSEFGIGVCYNSETVKNPHILNNVTCNLRYMELV